ncbi:MAG: SOS response-associated peptidase, partial [Clostridia bacterium]|nr:SOS response-associated peptidase [Clostridia bacterium]
FYMAGLSRYEVSTSAWHFVILTTPASASLAVLHDRQPLILPRNWLRSWMLSPGAARKMLDYIWHEPFALSAEA